MTENTLTVVAIVALLVIVAIVVYYIVHGRNEDIDEEEYMEKYDDEYEEMEEDYQEEDDLPDAAFIYQNNHIDILEKKLRQATRLNVSLFNILMDMIDTPQGEGTMRFHRLRTANTILSMDTDPDIRSIYHAVKDRVATDTITCYLAMLLDKYGGATTLTPDIYKSYVRNMNVIIYCQEQINRLENFDFNPPELRKRIEETDRAYERMIAEEEEVPHWSYNPIQPEPEPTYVSYDDDEEVMEQREDEDDREEDIIPVVRSFGPIATLKDSFKTLFGKYQGDMEAV